MEVRSSYEKKESHDMYLCPKEDEEAVGGEEEEVRDTADQDTGPGVWAGIVLI